MSNLPPPYLVFSPRFPPKVPAINAVLAILMVLLVYLAVNGEASIHVYVMGFLSIGLMGSLNW